MPPSSSCSSSSAMFSGFSVQGLGFRVKGFRDFKLFGAEYIPLLKLESVHFLGGL